MYLSSLAPAQSQCYTKRLKIVNKGRIGSKISVGRRKAMNSDLKLDPVEQIVVRQHTCRGFLSALQA